MFNSVIIVTVVLAAEGHPQFSKCLRNKWPMHPHQNMRKDLNNDVTYFTAIDMMFFQAVEKPVFLKLMRMAVPLYEVPSRKLFSKKLIPKVQVEVRAHVQK